MTDGIASADERWLPVVGGEGLYEVSDMGRVRSLARVVHSLGDDKRGPYTRKIKSCIIANGRGHPYLSAKLVLPGGGKVTRRVHTMVLEAFVGPLPDGQVTRHLNGDHTDNRLENLRYGTREENWADLVSHVRYPGASKSHCKRNHAKTPENRYPNARGCRACARERARERGSLCPTP